jgi:peptide chain release factor 1
VAVLPEATEAQVRLDERELEWQTCRGSGAGGQHRNVTASAFQVKHIPTGIIVRAENERSQHLNKQFALETLRARLWEVTQLALDGKRAYERKRQVGSGMRGDKRRTIRTQDDSVVDHETGRTWRFKDYIRGNW